MKKELKEKKPVRAVKKPVVKPQTDPYCAPGTHWDKDQEKCIPDIG